MSSYFLAFYIFFIVQHTFFRPVRTIWLYVSVVTNIASLPNQRQMRVWHLSGLRVVMTAFSYKHPVPTGLKNVIAMQINP